MNRRNFFGVLAVSPIAAAALPPPMKGVAPAGFERVSCTAGDPGERAFALSKNLGKIIKVKLDGKPQPLASMADANIGVVRRAVKGPDGNLLCGVDSVIEEDVHGFVEIELV